MVNKKISLLFVIIGLLSLISLASAAVTIPNPLAPGGVNNFGDLLLKIAGAVGALVGALGTIMIIVAGIFYLTSAGSPDRITKAKTALMYAIVGIVIGIAATAIVEIIKTTLGAK